MDMFNSPVKGIIKKDQIADYTFITYRPFIMEMLCACTQHFRKAHLSVLINACVECRHWELYPYIFSVHSDACTAKTS